MAAVNFSPIDWQTKETALPPPKFQIDPYKVSHVVAIAFALLAVADIVLRLGLSLSSLGFFITPVAWMICGGVLLISVVFIAGIYYIQEKSRQKNYKDPEELQRLKEAAIDLKFDKLLQEHTPNNLVTYIFNEPDSSLSLSALQEKFQRHAKKAIDFESFARNYDLKQLTELNIINQGFVLFLRSLEKEIDVAQKDYHEKIKQLEKSYPLRLSNLNAGISSIYDFFTDRYKIIRTSIQYGMNSADIPKLQQIKYNRAEGILKGELKETCAKIQQKYSETCQDFFPLKIQGINQEILETEKNLN